MIHTMHRTILKTMFCRTVLLTDSCTMQLIMRNLFEHKNKQRSIFYTT